MIVFVFVLIKVEVNESQSQRSTKGQQVNGLYCPGRVTNRTAESLMSYNDVSMM